MTTDQRNLISAVEGLLVYDTDFDAFFLRGSSAWINLSSSSEIWSQTATNVYLTDPTKNIGIGTSVPTSKFVVQANSGDLPEAVLFEVKDEIGNHIFKVTSEGVRVFVKDETVTKGVSGGFAVGRYGTAKGVTSTIFSTNADSTRIYTKTDTKGVSGGFAVGRYGTAKGSTDNYMHISKENYMIGHSSGQALTTGQYNIFVGFQSGFKNRTGQRNTFLGHNSGYNNTWGDNNIYIGDSSGYSTVYAHDNIFLGNSAGFNTEADDPLYGSQNVFVGNFSGYKNLEGYYNVYVGQSSGHDNLNGSGNVFVGGLSGEANLRSDNTFIGGASFYKNTTGSRNATLGAYSGQNNLVGSGNVFLGYSAGFNELGSNKLYIENSNIATPLIYGEFDTDILRFNANVGISITPSEKLHVNGNVYASGGDFYTSAGNGVINCGGGIMNANVNVISDGTINNGYATGDEDLYINDVLKVDGVAYKVGSSSWVIQSDKRLKKDIEVFSDGLDKILQMKPVSYKYNEKTGIKNSKTYVGIIAQEMIDIAPYTVELTPFNKQIGENEKGEEYVKSWEGEEYYTFDSAPLTYILINAVKEQQSQIEDLKIQIQELVKIVQSK